MVQPCAGVAASASRFGSPPGCPPPAARIRRPAPAQSSAQQRPRKGCALTDEAYEQPAIQTTAELTRRAAQGAPWGALHVGGRTQRFRLFDQTWPTCSRSPKQWRYVPAWHEFDTLIKRRTILASVTDFCPSHPRLFTGACGIPTRFWPSNARADPSRSPPASRRLVDCRVSGLRTLALHLGIKKGGGNMALRAFAPSNIAPPPT